MFDGSDGSRANQLMRNPAAELARRSHVHAFVQGHAGFTANFAAEAVGSAAVAAATAAARRRCEVAKQPDTLTSPSGTVPIQGHSLPGLALDLLLASGEKKRKTGRAPPREEESNACKDVRADSANTDAGVAAAPPPQLRAGPGDSQIPNPQSSSTLSSSTEPRRTASDSVPTLRGGILKPLAPAIEQARSERERRNRRSTSAHKHKRARLLQPLINKVGILGSQDDTATPSHNIYGQKRSIRKHRQNRTHMRRAIIAPDLEASLAKQQRRAQQQLADVTLANEQAMREFAAQLPLNFVAKSSGADVTARADACGACQRKRPRPALCIVAERAVRGKNDGPISAELPLALKLCADALEKVLNGGETRALRELLSRAFWRWAAGSRVARRGSMLWHWHTAACTVQAHFRGAQSRRVAAEVHGALHEPERRRKLEQGKLRRKWKRRVLATVKRRRKAAAKIQTLFHAHKRQRACVHQTRLHQASVVMQAAVRAYIARKNTEAAQKYKHVVNCAVITLQRRLARGPQHRQIANRRAWERERARSRARGITLDARPPDDDEDGAYWIRFGFIQSGRAQQIQKWWRYGIPWRVTRAATAAACASSQAARAALFAMVAMTRSRKHAAAAQASAIASVAAHDAAVAAVAALRAVAPHEATAAACATAGAALFASNAAVAALKAAGQAAGSVVTAQVLLTLCVQKWQCFARRLLMRLLSRLLGLKMMQKSRAVATIKCAWNAFLRRKALEAATAAAAKWNMRLEIRALQLANAMQTTKGVLDSNVRRKSVPARCSSCDVSDLSKRNSVGSFGEAHYKACAWSILHSAAGTLQRTARAHLARVNARVAHQRHAANLEVQRRANALIRLQCFARIIAARQHFGRMVRSVFVQFVEPVMQTGIAGPSYWHNPRTGVSSWTPPRILSHDYCDRPFPQYHRVKQTIQLPREGEGIFVPCDRCAAAPCSIYTFGVADDVAAANAVALDGEALVAAKPAIVVCTDGVGAAARAAAAEATDSIPLSLRARGEEALCTSCWQSQCNEVVAASAQAKLPTHRRRGRREEARIRRFESVVRTGRWCQISTCSECEFQIATRRCSTCRDAFCDTCFAAVHQHMQRRHKWTPLMARCTDCDENAAVVATRPRLTLASREVPERRERQIQPLLDDDKRSARAAMFDKIVSHSCMTLVSERWRDFDAQLTRESGDDDDEIGSASEVDLSPAIAFGDGGGNGGRLLCRPCFRRWAAGREAESVPLESQPGSWHRPFAPAPLPLRTSSIAAWRATEAIVARKRVAQEAHSASVRFAEERRRQAAATSLSAGWRGFSVRALPPWRAWRAERRAWISQCAADVAAQGGMHAGCCDSACGPDTLLGPAVPRCAAVCVQMGRVGPGIVIGMREAVARSLAFATDTAERCALRQLPASRLLGRLPVRPRALPLSRAMQEAKLRVWRAGRKVAQLCVRGRWTTLKIIAPLEPRHVHEARQRLGLDPPCICSTDRPLARFVPSVGAVSGSARERRRAVHSVALAVAKAEELADLERKRHSQGDNNKRKKGRKMKEITQVVSKYEVNWVKLSNVIERESRAQKAKAALAKARAVARVQASQPAQQ